MKCNINNKYGVDEKLNNTTTYFEEINVGGNAREIPSLQRIYDNIPNTQGFEYSAINLAADGSMYFHIFMPLPTKKEIEDFHNKPVKIYQKELGNGTYSTSVRGFTSFDIVFDPTIYPYNYIQNIKKGCICTAIMVDTITNTVVGIRMFSLNKKFYDEFHKSCVNMLDRGCTTKDMYEGLYKYVLPLSIDRLQKTSVYLGGTELNTTTEKAC